VNQTRLESLVEAAVNTASGFLVSLVVQWAIIMPIWDLDWTFWDNLAVTTIFTIASVARSYLWRRFFNAQLHKGMRRLFQ
jgi:membrane protein implicated in regulation of membrane protease activity